MNNPFSWDYLTTVPGPDEVFGPFAIVFLILFGVGFVLSIVLYNDGAKRYVDHGLKRRTIQRFGGIAMLIFGVGLFFFAIRMLQINPFSFGMRLWLWLSLLALLSFGAAVVYYLRVSYPQERVAYETRKMHGQYLRPQALGSKRRQSGAIPMGRRPVRRKARR